MSQGWSSEDLDQLVGYVLKQAATALRNAMDVALRPQGLTVPQYACLELLGRQPGLSNSDLARGAFVTRQSMNQVLRGLQDRGLVTRPTTATHGRTLPTRLTPAGEQQLRAAAATVETVEGQMLSGLSSESRHRLRDDLAACVTALNSDPASSAGP